MGGINHQKWIVYDIAVPTLHDFGILPSQVTFMASAQGRIEAHQVLLSPAILGIKAWLGGAKGI